MMRQLPVMAVIVMASCLARADREQASTLQQRFDFTQPGAVASWQPTHDVGRIVATPAGMQIEITGGDPYVTYSGAPLDFPAGQILWLRMRLRSDEGGMGQVFYFKRNTREEDSVRFPVRAGVWEEVRV